MPNEEAVRMTAPEEPGLQLLKGKVSKVADLGILNGIKKVLFNVGRYTCKAYGEKADMIKEKQGQIVELRGQWERLRRNPNEEEFVVKGFYTGEAFESASAPPLTTEHSSKTVVQLEAATASVLPHQVIGILTEVRQVSPRKAIGKVGDHAVAVFENFDAFMALVGKKMKFVGRWQTTKYGDQFIINARRGAGNEIIEDSLPAAANHPKEDHIIAYA